MRYLFCNLPTRCLIWRAGAFTVSNDLYDPVTESWNLSPKHIFKQQDVWYVLGMTTWYMTFSSPFQNKC